MDGEFVVPGPGHGVERGFLFGGEVGSRVEAGDEFVLGAFHAEEGFAGEVDGGDVPAGGGDVVGAIEFGVGGSGEEVLDLDGGEGDEVVFVVFVEVHDGVADLLDVDAAVEGDFLAGVARGADSGCVVPEVARCYWWVVAGE